jgi:hypothetical protein
MVIDIANDHLLTSSYDASNKNVEFKYRENIEGDHWYQQIRLQP